MEKQHLLKQQLFQCPICDEIPLAEVFQCHKGHMLCDRCILKVRSCPQCRVPFGENKIRNLALEAVLDEMLLNCSNEEYGCDLTMTRHQLEAHNKICEFKAVNICRNLGHTNCGTKVASGVALFNHLQTQHRMPMNNSATNRKGLIFFSDGVTSCDWPNYRTMYDYWQVEIKGKIEQFLLLTKIGQGLNGPVLNCAVLYLGDGSPQNAEGFLAKIDLDLHVQGRKQMQRICTWTGAALHFKCAEDDTLIPYLSTPMKYIKERFNLDKNSTFLLYVKATVTEGTNDIEEESSSDSSDGDSEDDSDANGSERRIPRPPPNRNFIPVRRSVRTLKRAKLN